MHRVALLLLAPFLLLADPPTMFPAVRGTREIIAAGNHYQVEAGWRMLQAGGNATDAGVAAILAATVTEHSRIGLGGETPLLIKQKGKDVVAISGIGVAPKLATVDAYRNRKMEPFETEKDFPPIPGTGAKAAITPGLLDGLILALRKYGSKSFSDVVAPAIALAEGFPIGEENVQFLNRERPQMLSFEYSMKLFYPNGATPKAGDLFRNPDLARTLRTLVDAEKKARGSREAKLLAVRNEFYKGKIARDFATYSEKVGGFLRYEDMATYQAEEDQPRSVEFQGFTVHKPGFWTQGPVLLQALQILKGYDLKAMGHNSPEYLHTVIEAVKLAFADRDQHYGDPKFSKIPEQWLLSDRYAAERRALIDPSKASLDHRPGKGPITSQAVPPKGLPANDTTCVNVVDRWGNMFSATPSGAWIPAEIAGSTGIPFSMRAESFVLTDGHPNQIAPGKRPRVTLSPTIITRNGDAYLAMSTPGGDNQDQAMLQVLLNILVFGMNPQDAVEAPRFQTEHFYASFANHEFFPGSLMLEDRIAPATIAALQAKGHKVKVTKPWSNGSAPTVILVGKDVLQGGADPRRNRFILAR